MRQYEMTVSPPGVGGSVRVQFDGNPPLPPIKNSQSLLANEPASQTVLIPTDAEHIQFLSTYPPIRVGPGIEICRNGVFKVKECALDSTGGGKLVDLELEKHYELSWANVRVRLVIAKLREVS